MAGYEFKEVYEGNDPFPYAVYANATNFRVVKLGTTSEIYTFPTNSRTYVGTTNGFIVTKTGNEVWVTNISSGTNTRIANEAFDDILISDNGSVFVFRNTSYNASSEGRYYNVQLRARIIARRLVNGNIQSLYTSNILLGGTLQVHDNVIKRHLKISSVSGSSLVLVGGERDSSAYSFFINPSGGCYYFSTLVEGWDDWNWEPYWYEIQTRGGGGIIGANGDYFLPYDSFNLYRYTGSSKISYRTKSEYREGYTWVWKQGDYWSGMLMTMLFSKGGINYLNPFNEYGNDYYSGSGNRKILADTETTILTFASATSEWSTDMGVTKLYKYHAGNFIEIYSSPQTTWTHGSGIPAATTDNATSIAYIRYRQYQTDVYNLMALDLLTGEVIFNEILPITEHDKYFPTFAHNGQLFNVEKDKIYKIKFNTGGGLNQEELDSAINPINTKITNIENKNTQQDTTINNHTTKITNIETVNNTQNTRLTSIENKNTQQDTTINNHISRLAELEKDKVPPQIISFDTVIKGKSLVIISEEGGNINLKINAKDNLTPFTSMQYAISHNEKSYSTWKPIPANGIITAPIQAGVNNYELKVRDNAPTPNESIPFKLERMVWGM